MLRTAQELITYASQQIGQPYCWGGNGETLYQLIKDFATRKSQGSTSTASMLEFLNSNGIKDCSFYDCSGLLVKFFLDNGAIKNDMTAHDIYVKSTKVDHAVDGCLAFLLKDSKAYHVGVVDGDTVIHAFNQKKGVIRESIAKRKWVYALPLFAVEYPYEQKLEVGSTILLKADAKVYNSSDKAIAGLSDTQRTYKAGCYFVYKVANNCVNITKSYGVAGAWISLENLRKVV